MCSVRVCKDVMRVNLMDRGREVDDEAAFVRWKRGLSKGNVAGCTGKKKLVKVSGLRRV